MTDFAQSRIEQEDDEPPLSGSGAVRLDDLLDLSPSQRVGDPPPGYGAVRLDDFLNPPPPPLPPLRQTFEGHVAIMMRMRGLSRFEAERAAFENTVVDHLNATHPDTLSDRCAHCGKCETPHAILLPIAVGVRHAWLHPACWAPWREGRRLKAEHDLVRLGVAKP